MASKKKKLYLVQRLAWRPVGDRDFRRGMCEQHEPAEGVPVGAFETRANASKRAKELTALARQELNPFQFTFHRVEPLMEEGDEESLLAALDKMGLPVPTKMIPTKWSDCLDWPAWYDEIVESLTDDEREAIWNLLDSLALYRVVAVEFL